MLILALLLLLANLLILAAIFLRQQRTRTLLADSDDLLRQLQPLHRDLAPQLREQLESSGSRVLSVEILNPLEVAAQENWFAGQVGGAVPSLVRREVYRQARDIMQKELEKFGVRARVRLHGEGSR